MKTKILCLTAVSFLLFMLCSCGLFNETYRYSYIRPGDKKSNLKSYSIKDIRIYNSEALFLDSEVVSNTVCQVFNAVMENNGILPLDGGDLSIEIKVYIEENDIINNRQTLSMFFTFDDKTSQVAQFIVSSKSKDLILDKSTLIGEIDNIVKQVKSL